MASKLRPGNTLLILAAVVAAVSTGCNDEIYAGDFDQSCDVDEDCVIVTEGDYCDRNSCNCPNAAISVDALEAWESAVAELYTCSSRVMCDCWFPEAWCNDGRCDTRDGW